jgi:hypothetical protein
MSVSRISDLPPALVLAISAFNVASAGSTSGPNRYFRYSVGMRGFDSSMFPSASKRGGEIGGT